MRMNVERREERLVIRWDVGFIERFVAAVCKVWGLEVAKVRGRCTEVGKNVNW